MRPHPAFEVKASHGQNRCGIFPNIAPARRPFGRVPRHMTKQSDTIFALSLTNLTKLAHFLTKLAYFRNAIRGVYATSRTR